MSLPQPLVRVAFHAASLLPYGRRWMRRRLPPVEMEVDGARFDLVPTENYVDYKLWAYRKPYEKASLDKMVALLEGTDALFVDIGANVGLYSVMVGRRLGPGAQIISIEPNPVLNARLQRNLDLNGLTSEVHACALGDAEGTATLSITEKDMGGASLLKEREGWSHRRRWANEIEVPVRPLADILGDRADGRPFAIKIDVEGAEDMVLCPYLDTAAPEALPRWILLEDANAPIWRRDLLAELKSAGYAETFRADGNLLYERAPAGTP